MSEPIRVPNGLYGVAITDTSIGKSDASGSLIYRGYDVRTLFESASFEEVAFLILRGHLPTRSELTSFSSDLAARMEVPETVFHAFEALPPDALPMDVLRTAVSALGAVESRAAPAEQELSIIAKVPTLVANCHRVGHRSGRVRPKPGLGYASNLLGMLNQTSPPAEDSRALEQELILYMEHDLNASSFAVRVVASTQADVYAAVTAGLGALKGPLHGGANEAAMKLLLAIDDPGKAKSYVEGILARHERVMGFGHRIYKKFDPRAQLSKTLLRSLLAAKGEDDRLYRLCDEVEKTVWAAKGLPPNLDFYAAPIFYTLGIPIEVYTPIFAASRVVGWVAHFNEQRTENKIIRPDAAYVGPKGLTYVSIDKR